jgi:hypothetical protein
MALRPLAEFEPRPETFKIQSTLISFEEGVTKKNGKAVIHRPRVRFFKAVTFQRALFLLLFKTSASTE